MSDTTFDENAGSDAEDDWLFPLTGVPNDAVDLHPTSRYDYTIDISSDEDTPGLEIVYGSSGLTLENQSSDFELRQTHEETLSESSATSGQTTTASSGTEFDESSHSDSSTRTLLEVAGEGELNSRFPVLNLNSHSRNTRAIHHFAEGMASPFDDYGREEGETTASSTVSSVSSSRSTTPTNEEHLSSGSENPAQQAVTASSVSNTMNPETAVERIAAGSDLSTQNDFRVNAPGPDRPCTSTKRKLSSPSTQTSSKKCAKDANSSDDDDEGICCPICFEKWTNSGRHRLVSLRCGHLFGQKCVERWLKDSHQKCPQCNSKAKRSDIRIIYAKKLRAIDTTDLEQALRTADQAKNEKREREMELAKVRLQYTMAMEECNRLKKQMKSMTTLPDQCASPSASSAMTPASRGRLYEWKKNVLIHSGGGCRVMAFDEQAGYFAVSQPSPHANFMNGFGVKKLSAVDFKSGYFTLLHQKPIKDIRFSPHHENRLLTASQDGNLRITDLGGNTKIHEYKLKKPIWSCSWNKADSNMIYAGLSNGSYMQFDLRNTADAISTLENTTSRCPVVSLYHVPPSCTETFRGHGGLLTSTLEGAMFWQDVDGSGEIADFKPTILPLEAGSCSGLQYCNDTQHCLVTFRPGRSYPTTSHILCELRCTGSAGVTRRSSEAPAVSCNVVHTFRGGQTHKVLTRNALFALPSESGGGQQLTACVCDEAKKVVQVYDATQCRLVQTLQCDGLPPLDVVSIRTNSQTQLLATLNEQALRVYVLR